MAEIITSPGSARRSASGMDVLDMSNSSEDSSDPRGQVSRNPPDMVTEPCLTYMARIMELRNFVGFYFSFVESSAALSKLLPAEVKNSADTKGREVLQYNFSAHRSFINQIMLSRAVESFDLYLGLILRDIFLARPEILKSEGTIDITSIIEAGNYDDLIWRIAERKVHELSYKSLAELRKFVQGRTGIDLFQNKEAFETTILASELRNLIAHNDCIVNELFKSRIKDIPMELEISSTNRVQISDEWLRKASYTLDSLVFRFDELAAAKFSVHTRNRMSSFILRA